MDLTQGTPKEKNIRAKKMMLWFGIISLVMSFGGLTSAFIVSSTREDWLSNFDLPQSFTASTVLIVMSSIVLYFFKKALQKKTKSVESFTSHRGFYFRAWFYLYPIFWIQ